MSQLEPGEFWNREFGRNGELLARSHLERSGLRCLGTNYQTRWGELDLICMEGETIVFVEVKRRCDHRFGSPDESVPPWKQSRMVRCAMHYVRRFGLADRMLRFDVVAIDGRGIRHHRHAFEPEPGDFYL